MMAKNIWKTNKTTLVIKFRCMAVPFIKGAGYSNASMVRPIRIDIVWMTGVLTIMSIKNAS